MRTDSVKQCARASREVIRLLCLKLAQSLSRALFIFAVAASNLWPSFGFGWSSSVNVPLDHWSYDAVTILEAKGLIDSRMHGTRPLTREELARLTVEAEKKLGSLGPSRDGLVDELLQRLEKEFEDEVRKLKGEKLVVPPTFLKPIDEMIVDYVHLKGRPVTFFPKGDGRGLGSIDATEGAPLVRYNEGIKYGQGENFGLTIRSYANLFNRFSLYFEPYFSLKGDIGGDWEADPHIHKGYVKTYLGPLEFEFGRDTIWWGQGSQGSLVFTNNAAPMDMLKLSTPHPVILPWILSRIGLVKAATFVARIESKTEISHFLLWGGRLNIKPFPWLELGVTGGMQFNGEGLPGLEAADWLELLRLRNVDRGKGPEKTNQMMALDARFTIPFLRNTQVYVEYGGEEERGSSTGKAGRSNLMVSEPALILGLFVPRLTDDGRTQLTLEWMRNNFGGDGIPAVWYAHWTYVSGWTNDRMILGHAAGGDSSEIFVRVTRDVTSMARIGLDFSYQDRGRDLVEYYGCGDRERHFRGGVDLRWFPKESWEFRARMAVEGVENFGLSPGKDRTNWLLRLTLSHKF